MSQTGIGGFFARLVEDFHSARRYAHCRLEAKHLANQKELAQMELQGVYQLVGSAAQAAQLGQDLPLWSAVVDRNRRLAEAQAVLAQKTAAVVAAQAALDAQTQKHTQIIAALEAEYKPLAAAAAAAAGAVDATTHSIASLQSEIQKMQAQVQRLVSGEMPPEPVAELQARLQEAQQQAKAAELKLNISVAAMRTARQTADAKGDDLKAAQKARSEAMARTQADVATAQAKADAAALKAAQDAQAAAKTQHEQAVAAAEQQASAAAAAIEAARLQNKTAESEDQALRQKVQHLTAVIAAKQLSQQAAQKQAEIKSLQERLVGEQQTKTTSASSAAGKGAQLAQARTAWQQVQAQCAAELAAARAAQAAATKEAQAAMGPLNDAVRDFGRAIYDAGIRDPRLDEPISRADVLRTKVDDQMNQITQLQGDADRARTGARRFAWVSGAAAVIVIVLIVIVISLVRGCQ